MLLKQFKFLAEGSIFDHLWSDASSIVTARYGSEATTNRPDVLHGLQHFIVNRPRDLAEDIEDLAHGLQVSLRKVVQSCLKLWLYLGHLCLSQIVATKEEVLPWCWGIDHGKRAIELQVQIVTLVQLLHKFLHKGFVEADMSDDFFGCFILNILVRF